MITSSAKATPPEPASWAGASANCSGCRIAGSGLPRSASLWLLTNWLVTDVTSEWIAVRPPWSQSRLKFYRKDTLRGGAIKEEKP
jgi:hypothetical protein